MAGFGLGQFVSGISQGREDRRQIQRQEAQDEQAAELHRLNVQRAELGLEVAKDDIEHTREVVRPQQAEDRQETLRLRNRQQTLEGREDEAYEMQARSMRLSQSLNQAMIPATVQGDFRGILELMHSEDDLGFADVVDIRQMVASDGSKTVIVEREDGQVQEMPFDEYMGVLVAAAQPEGMMRLLESQRAGAAEANRRVQDHLNELDLIFARESARGARDAATAGIDAGLPSTTSTRISTDLGRLFGGSMENGLLIVPDDRRDDYTRAAALSSRAWLRAQELGVPMTDQEAVMLGYQAIAGVMSEADATRMAQNEYLNQTGKNRVPDSANGDIAARAQAIVNESRRARELAQEMGIWNELVEDIGQRGQRQQGEQRADEAGGRRPRSGRDYLNDAMTSGTGMGLQTGQADRGALTEDDIARTVGMIRG